MLIGPGVVVVVTGGASGIGRSCATEFARRGADVVIADVHEERVSETQAALQDFGVRVLGVRCDVTSDDDMDRLRDQSIGVMGHVDVIMNNAGVALLGPPERIPIDDWRWIFEVNVLGLVRGVKAFVPHFQERGSGHVINTASVAGLYAYSWDSIPYITSKFGAYGFSEGLFVYLKPQGIGVSVICPGLVATNLGETARRAGLTAHDAWGYMPPHMTPIDLDTVGAIVAGALAEDRFLILTHPEDALRIESRHHDIEAALLAQVAASPGPPKLGEFA